MDRSLWNRSITKYMCPKWSCRYCSSGIVILEQKSLKFIETEESKQLQRTEEGGPFDIDFSFTAWGKCSNSSCNQQYAIAGCGGLEDHQTGPEEWEWEEYFIPKTCYPMPDIFKIPNKCPPEITTSIRSAFSLFLQDINSCAGKIRIAIELLLNNQSIPTHTTSNKGRKYKLNLHKRIELYSEIEPTISKNLLALKWLGNTAAHENFNISREEMLDAFEIIEHSLIEIIEMRSTRVAHLARNLTEKFSRNED